MSNVIVVVNPKNADRNTLREIADAVASIGGTDVTINEECHVIEATIPSHELPTVAAIEGVSYVRNVFTFMAGPALEPAA